MLPVRSPKSVSSQGQPPLSQVGISHLLFSLPFMLPFMLSFMRPRLTFVLSCNVCPAVLSLQRMHQPYESALASHVLSSGAWGFHDGAPGLLATLAEDAMGKKEKIKKLCRAVPRCPGDPAHSQALGLQTVEQPCQTPFPQTPTAPLRKAEQPPLAAARKALLLAAVHKAALVGSMGLAAALIPLLGSRDPQALAHPHCLG